VSRGLSVDNQDAVDASIIAPIIFSELDFSGGFVRVHSAVGTINWGGYDWLGVGTFGQVSPIEDSAELQRQTVTYTLSGIPSEMMSVVLSETYQGRGAKTYLGFIDRTTGILADTPVLIALGKMDVSSIEQGKELTVSVTAESRMSAWNRPQIRRYTHTEQQSRFAGDRGLEFIDQASRKEIIWGRKA
jgi:hypothetical protein